MKFRQTLLSLGVAAGLAMVAGNVQAGVIVHLFQWKFNDVANECEKVLGPKGFLITIEIQPALAIAEA